jgi:hypothetical protein
MRPLLPQLCAICVPVASFDEIHGEKDQKPSREITPQVAVLAGRIGERSERNPPFRRSASGIATAIADWRITTFGLIRNTATRTERRHFEMSPEIPA